MNMGSAGNQSGWRVDGRGGVPALEVVLHKASYVLSWAQFLYAEGREDEVRLVFATHDVVVRGSGLGALLTDAAAQRLAALVEPRGSDRFRAHEHACVRALEVRQVGREEG